MVEFRKRLTDEILIEINEMIAEYNSTDDTPLVGNSDGDDESENRGSIILDATCAPQQISYPQVINLLKEARENLEAIIDTICYEYNYRRSWMYHVKSRKDYLSLAKCRRRSPKKIRKAI